MKFSLKLLVLWALASFAVVLVGIRLLPSLNSFNSSAEVHNIFTKQQRFPTLPLRATHPFVVLYVYEGSFSEDRFHFAEFLRIATDLKIEYGLVASGFDLRYDFTLLPPESRPAAVARVASFGGSLCALRRALLPQAKEIPAKRPAGELGAWLGGLLRGPKTFLAVLSSRSREGLHFLRNERLRYEWLSTLARDQVDVVGIGGLQASSEVGLVADTSSVVLRGDFYALKDPNILWSEILPGWTCSHYQHLSFTLNDARLVPRLQAAGRRVGLLHDLRCVSSSSSASESAEGKEETTMLGRRCNPGAWPPLQGALLVAPTLGAQRLSDYLGHPAPIAFSEGGLPLLPHHRPLRDSQSSPLVVFVVRAFVSSLVDPFYNLTALYYSLQQQKSDNWLAFVFNTQPDGDSFIQSAVQQMADSRIRFLKLSSTQPFRWGDAGYACTDEALNEIVKLSQQEKIPKPDWIVFTNADNTYLPEFSALPLRLRELSYQRNPPSLIYSNYFSHHARYKSEMLVELRIGRVDLGSVMFHFGRFVLEGRRFSSFAETSSQDGVMIAAVVRDGWAFLHDERFLFSHSPNEMTCEALGGSWTKSECQSNLPAKAEQAWRWGALEQVAGGKQQALELHALLAQPGPARPDTQAWCKADHEGRADEDVPGLMLEHLRACPGNQRWHPGKGLDWLARPILGDQTALLVLDDWGLFSGAEAFATASHSKGLVLYAVNLGEKASNLDNFEFFLQHAVQRPSHLVDYVVIFNGPAPAPEQLEQLRRLPHVALLQRQNTGFDFGAWEAALRALGAISDPAARTPEQNSAAEREFHLRYARVFLINVGVRGPFLAPGSLPTEWARRLGAPIDATVKLAGISISCESGAFCPIGTFCGPQMHVQSMVLATDSVGLKVLVAGEVFREKEDVRQVEVEKGEGSDEAKQLVIYHSELGASIAILKEGYNIAALPWGSAGIDWRNALVSKKECKRIEAHVPKKRSGNPFFATDLSPFETVFIKTNKNLPIFEYVEQVSQRMQSASDVVIRQDGFIRQKKVKQSRAPSKQRSKRRRPRRRPVS